MEANGTPRPHTAGRNAYILALSRYCKGFWESLRDEVLRPGLDLQQHEAPWSEINRLLVAWFEHWQIEDEWLKKAAANIFQYWLTVAENRGMQHLEGFPLPVFCAPDADELSSLGPFVPVFESATFLPEWRLSESEQETLEADPSDLASRIFNVRRNYETVAAFKARMEPQFRKQLDAYTSSFELSVRSYPPDQNDDIEIQKHAAWTALFQVGKYTLPEIHNWELNRTENEVLTQTIHEAVKRFASSIGLTLRTPKRGRPAGRHKQK
jgi:hypothetical protein